ncbi:hypothetical protein KP509_13G036900 [Ceratopteris richardii]|nr:hypothetical protein KP509_13G036900 [Ceratopteris richardii]
MERFVRFVSTPEVLQRVSSVEVELLQIEEMIQQQTADLLQCNGTGQVDSIPSKIGIYHILPGERPAATMPSDNSTKMTSDGVDVSPEETSKQKLLKALDARRIMLQKEQGMAFARALAAGFSVENMNDLVSFAECFGADPLRDACIKFMAFVKKRQEAGLGLEDLELMAAQNVPTDMLYMGGSSTGNVGGIVWPQLQENGYDLSYFENLVNGMKQAATADSAEKRPRPEEQTGVRSASGDSEAPVGIVRGHPIMASWQGHTHAQLLPSIHPNAAMHAGMPNPFCGLSGPAKQGHMGLPYPPYLGSPYVPPGYPNGNGWHTHSFMPQQNWHRNQVSGSTEGSYCQSTCQQSTPLPAGERDDPQEPNGHNDDDVHDDQLHYASDHDAVLPGGQTRRPTSSRRRSASPMRRVQIGRIGGPKRSGMVVIKNINYITPNSKQQDDKVHDSSDNSEVWSGDDESGLDMVLENHAETLRTGIQNAVGIVGGKNQDIKHGRRSSKGRRIKASLMDIRESTINEELLANAEDKQDGSDHKEYLRMNNGQNEAADKSIQFHSEDFRFLESNAAMQDIFNPTSENLCIEKKGEANAHNHLVDDPLLSQSSGFSRSRQSESYRIFEQEPWESKREQVMDESCMIGISENIAISRNHGMVEPDFEFNVKINEDSQVTKNLQDDSFILLNQLAEKETAVNKDWTTSLNFESEIPLDKTFDVCKSAPETYSINPDDSFMIADRSKDTYNRSWNSPLDYDMQVLVADLIDNHNHDKDTEDPPEGDGTLVQELKDEEKLASELVSSQLSEKITKAKVMKEMLDKRKSLGGRRPGRSNPLVEVQQRAEKLRQYKAGLQKSKKEKEEEERKRIEDLKIQRQQRIAARSNQGSHNPSSLSISQTAKASPSANKPPPKVLNKASPFSPPMNGERVVNRGRSAHSNLDRPKPAENLVIRSVSSATELKREAKKPISILKSPSSPTLDSGTNGNVSHIEYTAKKKLGDDRTTSTNNRLTDNRVSKSYLECKEELRQTGNNPSEEKVNHSKINGHMSAGKSTPLTKRSTKLAAPQESLMPKVNFPKSSRLDSEAVGKTPEIPSKPAIGDKKTVSTSTACVYEEDPEDIVKKVNPTTVVQKENPTSNVIEVKIESPSLSSTQEPKLEENLESSGFIEPTESESPWHTISKDNGSCKENENAYQKDASHNPDKSIFFVNGVGLENGFTISSTATTVVESSKSYLSHPSLSLQADAAAGIDDTQHEIEGSSSAGEEYHAQVAHVSPSEYSHSELMEEELQRERHPVGDYSPPSEYSMSPTMHVAHETSIQQENHISGTKTRKKWGDSKAKGLKRLLLLSRKGGRNSTQNAVDIGLEVDPKDLSSSDFKNSHIEVQMQSDGSNEHAIGAVPAQVNLSPVNSSSKGSRSIFSLSNFRGKSK